MTRPEKLTSHERFERLLALIPEVVAAGGVARLSDLSQRFEYPVAMLKSDLKDILPYVAPWPRTYELLPKIGFQADTVVIENIDFFGQPAQLTWEEALRLYTSVTAVLDAGVSDSDAMKNAAQKLRTVLEAKSRLEDFERIMKVDAAEDIPEPIWQDIQRALRHKRKLRIKYYSFGRGQTSDREVDLYSIFTRRGSWHIKCWCHRAQALRTFRCDQIKQAELLDDHFEESPSLAASENKIYHPKDTDPRATLRLQPEAVWVTEAYDMEHSQQLPDGSWEVRLAVGNQRFLDYLLLLLKGSVELLAYAVPGDSPSQPVDLAAQATRKILARYQASS